MSAQVVALVENDQWLRQELAIYLHAHAKATPQWPWESAR